MNPNKERSHHGEILSRGPHDGDPSQSVLSLNTASFEEIAQVDFVGDSFARAIIELRERLGGFHSWEQLLQVDGLKPNKIAELQRKFSLENPVA